MKGYIITNLNEIYDKPNYRCLCLTDSNDGKFLNSNTVYLFDYKIVYVIKNNPWKHLKYGIRVKYLLAI